MGCVKGGWVSWWWCGGPGGFKLERNERDVGKTDIERSTG